MVEYLDFSEEAFIKPKEPKKTPTTKREKIDKNIPVVEQAILAYELFLSDAFALDYIGVDKKKRTFILDDPEYKRRTKQIRAGKYLEELDEIDDLSDTFRLPPDSDDYDLDNQKSQSAYENDRKAWLAGKLKVAEMRRDLRQMSKQEDEATEENILNVYFNALTREEFDAMKNHEIHKGQENADSALAKEGESKSLTAAQKIFEETENSEATGGYRVNADGTVEDW